MACVLAVTVYFRGADGLMLVFDVTSEESFENTRNWIRDINKHVEKGCINKSSNELQHCYGPYFALCTNLTLG